MKRKHQKLVLSFLLGVLSTMLIVRVLALESMVQEMRIERAQQIRAIVNAIQEISRG